MKIVAGWANGKYRAFPSLKNGDGKMGMKGDFSKALFIICVNLPWPHYLLSQ